MIPLTPPYKPAIGESAIEFFESILEPDFVAFEWGTGGSTLWLAERITRVVTVENLPAWLEIVRGYACEAGLDNNIHWLLFHWEKGQPYRDQMLRLYCHAIDAFPNNYFDLAFSDGWDISRPHCPELAMAKVRPGGWIVVDDSTWNPAAHSARILRDAGWYEQRCGGVTHAGWDGRSRRNTTAFFRRPE